LAPNHFSIIIITRGSYNRPFSGRRVEGTQFGLHPPLCELKKNYISETYIQKAVENNPVAILYATLTRNLGYIWSMVEQKAILYLINFEGKYAK
jgi:hypothetical protein